MTIHPFLQDDFYVQWSQLTPDCIIKDLDLVLEQTKTQINNIVTQEPDSLTYESTLWALEEAWGARCDYSGHVPRGERRLHQRMRLAFQHNARSV